MTNLATWVPRLLEMVTEDLSGAPIDHIYWNNKWNLHQAQGDDTATTLYDTIAQLYNTVWKTEDAASQISALALTDDDGTSNTNIGAALTWLHSRLAAVRPLVQSDGAEQLLHAAFPAPEELVDRDVGAQLDYLYDYVLNCRRLDVGINHNTLYQRDVDEAHPISAITGLQAVLDSMVLGEFVGALSHSAIANRSTADAHPISAITDLTTTLAALDADVVLNAGNYTTHIAAAASGVHKGVNINVDTDSGDATPITLQAKLNNVDAAVAAATGQVGAITHAGLTDIATSGHPIAAISGLQTALDAKANAADYQTKVLYGTDPPAPTLGDVGDLYCQILS